MFHSAAVKLTFWYLAIIMAISIFFSLVLYQVSSSDLYHNVNRQISYFNGFLGPDDSSTYSSLRHRQLDDDLNHLRANLITFNILVLIAGGAASYWLARRTLQPIETAMESQARFASDASHELRTPLTAIQTENEVALRNKSLTKAQAVNTIKSNLEEVAKLRALAEGLLRLAKGNGVIENPEAISAKDFITEAVTRYEKVAAAKTIKISNKVRDLKVKGDRQSLVELAAIFLDNAIKYSPSGSTVTITSRAHNKNVLIDFNDEGSGIKKADLPHIFERFYRAESARTKNSVGGYGLGLAIAKKITDAHHGHIEVTSTFGTGSSFTIYLPAA